MKEEGRASFAWQSPPQRRLAFARNRTTTAGGGKLGSGSFPADVLPWTAPRRQGYGDGSNGWFRTTGYLTRMGIMDHPDYSHTENTRGSLSAYSSTIKARDQAENFHAKSRHKAHLPPGEGWIKNSSGLVKDSERDRICPLIYTVDGRAAQKLGLDLFQVS